jgi:putative NIF3 family GTP cyclohydrolase 1 type 2
MGFIGIGDLGQLCILEAKEVRFVAIQQGKIQQTIYDALNPVLHLLISKNRAHEIAKEEKMHGSASICIN